MLIYPNAVRLAPLYDVLSALPYPSQIPVRARKLAMRVGREYLIRKIGRSHWEGLAARCDLDAEPVLSRVAEVVDLVAEAAPETAEEIRAEGIDHDVVNRLEKAIVDHSTECLRRLA